MALIKCPECGKEVSESEDICKNCGYPLHQSKIMNMNDDSASKDILQSTESKNPDIDNSKKKSRKICFLFFLVIILLICSAIGIYTVNKKVKIQKQQEEIKALEIYNGYIDDLNSIYSETLSGAEKAESVCVLTINVWKDAIYGTTSDETSKYLVGIIDFNDALENVYADSDMQEDLSEIKNIQKDVDTYIRNLQNSPDELSKAYDTALETYAAFTKLANLALSPEGSYNSYRKNEQTIVDDYVASYEMLKAVIPAKKTIPLYNTKNGKEIVDDFYFDIYINQMPDKLPSTVEDKSIPSISVYYTDTTTICGVEGKLYYNGMSVIDYIKWETDNNTQEFQNNILKKLREKYGQESTSDSNKYSWENLLATINEDGVSISWFNNK